MPEIIDENVIDEMRRVFQPQGSLEVVRLDFTGEHRYFNVNFVRACLDEIEKFVFNKLAGLEEKPTNLQTLAILLLMDSSEYYGSNLNRPDNGYTRGKS